MQVRNFPEGVSTFSIFQHNTLNCNVNSFSRKRPSQSACIIMLLLLLLWRWMTVKPGAIQQTPSFLLSIPDKKQNFSWLENQWHLAEADNFIIKTDDRLFFYPPVFFYYSSSDYVYLCFYSLVPFFLRTDMVSGDESDRRDARPCANSGARWGQGTQC
jgi:hypothetical protein